jgi:hypothetical protein
MMSLYEKFKRWSTWASVDEVCDLKPLAWWRRLAHKFFRKEADDG